VFGMVAKVNGDWFQRGVVENRVSVSA
jgi:hypothetical protein